MMANDSDLKGSHPKARNLFQASVYIICLCYIHEHDIYIYRERELLYITKQFDLLVANKFPCN